MRRLLLGACCVVCAVVLASRPAGGAGPAVFEVSWHSVDAGGGASTGGTLVLRGTIGQHDAAQPLTGGTFEVRGGFWGGGGFEPCPADCGDSDGVVGTVDLLALLAQWGGPGSCDIDSSGDGVVAIADLLDLLAAWGSCG